MKQRVIMAILLIAMAIPSFSQVEFVSHAPKSSSQEEVKSFQFGYMPEDTPYGTLSVAGKTAYAYIMLPKERTRLYDGCKITKVKVKLGTFRSRPDFKINITKDCREIDNFEYQQEAEVKSAESTENPVTYEIELDDPYVIEGGEDLYIGYQVAVSSSSRPIIAAADARYSRPGVNDLYGYYNYNDAYLSNSSGYANAIFVTIEGETIPDADLEILQSSVSQYGYLNGEVEVSAFLMNSGAKTINSFDLTYQLTYNGEQKEPVTNKVECEFPSCQFGNMTFKIPVEDDMDGNVDITYTLSNANGLEDPTPENSTWSGNFTVLVNAAERILLLENFTTGQCVNCPGGHKAIHEAIEAFGEDRVVWVCHHAGYYEDEMTTEDDTRYLWLFNGGSSAPMIAIDRTVFTPGSNTSVFFPSSTDYVLSVAEEAINVPAIVNLSSSKTYDETSRTLSITVDADLISNLIEGRKTYLNVFIMEDKIIARQLTPEGAIDDYEHNNVFRYAMTGTWGEEITFDGPVSKTYTYQLPDNWKTENLWACAFVSYYNSENPAQCDVLNTIKIPLNLPSGVAQLVDDDRLAISIRGNVLDVCGDDDATVYTIDGRRVASVQAHSSVELSKGLYIVVAGNKAQKVIVN